MQLARMRPQSADFLQTIASAISPLNEPLRLFWGVRGEAYCSIWNVRNINHLGGMKMVLRPSRSESASLTQGPPQGPFRSGGDIEGSDARLFVAKLMEFWTVTYRTIGDSTIPPLQQDARITGILRDLRKDRSPMGRAVFRAVEVFDGALGPSLKGQALAQASTVCLLLKVAELEGQGRLLPEDLGGQWIDPLSGAPFAARWGNGVLKVWSRGSRKMCRRGSLADQCEVNLPFEASALE